MYNINKLQSSHMGGGRGGAKFKHSFFISSKKEETYHVSTLSQDTSTTN